jgi:hypothetical protein
MVNEVGRDHRAQKKKQGDAENTKCCDPLSGREFNSKQGRKARHVSDKTMASHVSAGVDDASEHRKQEPVPVKSYDHGKILSSKEH